MGDLLLCLLKGAGVCIFVLVLYLPDSIKLSPAGIPKLTDDGLLRYCILMKDRKSEWPMSLQEHYRSTIDLLDDAIHVIDADMRIILMNRTFLAWNREIGLREDAVGKNLFEVFYFLLDAVRLEYEKLFRTGEPLVTDETNIIGDRKFYTETRKIPIVTNGAVTHVMTIIRDNTARKVAEEEKERIQSQLFQAQKMDAVGLLAGDMAHEFNNLLAIIQTLSYKANLLLPEGSPARDAVGEIRDTCNKAAEIVHKFLQFGRHEPLRLGPLDMNKGLVSIVKVIDWMIGEEFLIETDLAEDLRTIHADAGNVDQVVLNLVLNARDAMPEGGTIRIRTRNASLDEEECGSNPSARPGRFVRLSVADTGQGMDKETQSRIFEPFFSTKSKEKNYGIGLSVVDGIVKNHKGWIDVESRPGEGSTFRIYFPAHFDSH